MRPLTVAGLGLVLAGLVVCAWGDCGTETWDLACAGNSTYSCSGTIKDDCIQNYSVPCGCWGGIASWQGLPGVGSLEAHWRAPLCFNLAQAAQFFFLKRGDFDFEWSEVAPSRALNGRVLRKQALHCFETAIVSERWDRVGDGTAGKCDQGPLGLMGCLIKN